MATDTRSMTRADWLERGLGPKLQDHGRVASQRQRTARSHGRFSDGGETLEPRTIDEWAPIMRCAAEVSADMSNEDGWFDGSRDGEHVIEAQIVLLMNLGLVLPDSHR